MPKTRTYSPSQPGPDKKYPFDEWYEKMKKLKDDTFLFLSSGEDFDCSCRSMAEQLWKWAREEDVSVKVHIEDDGIYLRLK
tara:strand:- start:338 stop:580 length:243 start_codon:yes stop_codon:yes gene_type:complete